MSGTRGLESGSGLPAACAGEPTRSYRVVPFNEPDGRVTFAVQEVVNDLPRYFMRQLISYHPTLHDAETGRTVAYRKAGIA